MSDALPVTVVTGFLGAGKTTLVNEWLARAARGDIAVIVNEHADVGIDGEVFAARAPVVVELTGGCICCTTHTELVNALDSIARSATPPKRILIETSGAASPAGVLRAIVAGGRSGLLRLDGVVTVFDATRAEATLAHELALEQLGYADIVVLSRADLCDRETMLETTRRLAAQNAASIFVESMRGLVVSPLTTSEAKISPTEISPVAAPQAVESLEQLLTLRSSLPFVPRVVPVLQATHVYESVSFTHDGAVDGDRFADFVEEQLGAVAGRIFRIKGVLAVSDLDVRMIVQGVGDTVEVAFGDVWGDAPQVSRLVVVGFGLDREELSRGFASCVV